MFFGKAAAYSSSIPMPFWIRTMVVSPSVTAGLMMSGVLSFWPGKALVDTMM